MNNIKIDMDEINKKYLLNKKGLRNFDKKCKLNPESEYFDAVYHDDSEDEDLDTVTENFTDVNRNLPELQRRMCTVNQVLMDELEDDAEKTRDYLTGLEISDELNLNKIEINEGRTENKTVAKRKCRENKDKECVEKEVIEEAAKPINPDRKLTAYEIMNKTIQENMKDLKQTIRDLTDEQYQQFEGIQKTSDEKIELNKRLARKRSYVPCFGRTKTTVMEQIVYLMKLRGIVELMEKNQKSPQIIKDSNTADYNIKLTVSEAVEIPPYSQKAGILVKPMDESQVDDDLYLFHAAHQPRYSLQDGTFSLGEGAGTIANHSGKTLYLKPSHLVGYAKKAEFFRLPSIDDIFDAEDLVVNAVELVNGRYGIDPENPYEHQLPLPENGAPESSGENQNEGEQNEDGCNRKTKLRTPKNWKIKDAADLQFEESNSKPVSGNTPRRYDGPVAKECIRKLKEKLSKCPKSFQEMVERYTDVFLVEEAGQPVQFINCKPVVLPLRDNPPDYLPLPYKRGFNKDEQVAVDQWLQQSLMSGLITKTAHAKVLSPILIVRKVDEEGRLKTRFLLDARQINAKVLSQVSIPFPDIGEGLKNLSKCKFHTSMDVKSAFHRIPIAESSKTYTAFVVSSGSMVGTYVFNSLVQGALSSPAIFCSVMQEMLRKLHGDVQTYCFVDDNLTSSISQEQHEIDVEKVLSIFKQNAVIIDIKKSEFNESFVLWCGFRIGDGTYAPDPERLGKLDDLLKSIPSCKYSQLKRWQMTFGLTNYYRRFIHGYSKIEAGIRERIELVKEQKLGYREADLINYSEFKNIVAAIKRAALVITDRKDELRIRTDASISALGFVVETMDRRPVMFGGRKLSRAEKNLSMFELELLGVLYAIEKAHDLILNSPSTVIESDNLAGLKNLTGKSSHVVSCGALRTILSIQSRCASGKVRYAHIAGCLNYVSDYLSRCEEKIGNVSTVDPKEVAKMVINAVETRRTRGQLKEAENLETIRRLHEVTHDGVSKMVASCQERGLVVKNLQKRVQEIIYDCAGCNRERKVLFDTILSFSPTPSYPFEEIAVDHTFMTRSRAGSDNCLTIVDPFSKFFIAIPGDNHRIDLFVAVLKGLKQQFPLLRRVKADNAFNTKELKDWCARNGVELALNCSHNSRANCVERYNGTLKTKLEKFLNANKEGADMWEDYVADAVLSMNSSVHSVTKMAPHEIVYGEKAPVFRDFARDDVFQSKPYVEKVELVRERLKEDYPDYEEECAVIRKRIDLEKARYTHHAKDVPVLKEGEKVYIKYSHKDPLIPAEVVQDDGFTCVLQKTGRNQINQHNKLRVHKRHIWKRNARVLGAISIKSVFSEKEILRGFVDPDGKTWEEDSPTNYERWSENEEEGSEMDWETECALEEAPFQSSPKFWEE